MSSHEKKRQNPIAVNKKAKFDYFLEECFEAGIALKGWEIKSLRQGRVQLVDSYVLLKNREAWLIGSIITPLDTTFSPHYADPSRTRKLLLHRSQINKLVGAVQTKGYTSVCTSLYMKGHLVKAEVCLAKGKAQHDKREVTKERDWQRQKQRLLRKQTM